MNLSDFFVFLRRMAIFFFSFMTNTNMMSKDDKSEKVKCWIESLGSYHICENVLSEILFNIKSISRVAHSLDLSEVYQPCVNLEIRPDRKQKGDILSGGEDRMSIFSFHSLENSEYFRFLTELCVGHNNEESTMESVRMCKMVHHNCEMLKCRVPYNLSHEIDSVSHLMGSLGIVNTCERVFVIL